MLDLFEKCFQAAGGSGGGGGLLAGPIRLNPSLHSCRVPLTAQPIFCLCSRCAHTLPSPTLLSSLPAPDLHRHCALTLYLPHSLPWCSPPPKRDTVQLLQSAKRRNFPKDLFDVRMYVLRPKQPAS